MSVNAKLTPIPFESMDRWIRDYLLDQLVGALSVKFAVLVAAGVDDGVVGQEDADGGAVVDGVGGALQVDVAAVLGHDSAADPEAQAGASFAFGCEKWLEEAAEGFFGDAHAAVLDLHHNAGLAAHAFVVKAGWTGHGDQVDDGILVNG